MAYKCPKCGHMAEQAGNCPMCNVPLAEEAASAAPVAPQTPPPAAPQEPAPQQPSQPSEQQPGPQVNPPA